ncbi:MAG: class I SAM-dependent methyltransferase [Myxococcota bacterium]
MNRIVLEELFETRRRLRTVRTGATSRSLVAGVNALFRDAESRRPPHQRILTDNHARRFVEHHPLIWGLRLLRWFIPPLYREIARLQVAHCTRHRTIDCLVEEAIQDGFHQIVIVGAGYDSRAHRLDGGARFVEIDHPQTAQRKAALLDSWGAASPVPCELVGEGLWVGLSRAKLDLDAPICFVLEGLVHYLPPATLDAMIVAMATGTGRRRAVLSFIAPEMVQKSTLLFGLMVKMLDEVPRQHFSIAGLTQRFYNGGYHLTGHWPISDQIAAFVPQAATRPRGVSQDVARFDREARP